MAKATIKLNIELCKACEICVKLCPAKVLGIKDFKVAVIDADKCTACMSCELHCPDFAIEITKA